MPASWSRELRAPVVRAVVEVAVEQKKQTVMVGKAVAAQRPAVRPPVARSPGVGAQ